MLRLQKHQIRIQIEKNSWQTRQTNGACKYFNKDLLKTVPISGRSSEKRRETRVKIGERKESVRGGGALPSGGATLSLSLPVSSHIRFPRIASYTPPHLRPFDHCQMPTQHHMLSPPSSFD